MLVSFPRMGTSYIAFKDLIQRLGHDVLVPPVIDDKTLSLGTKYSPEFACVPYKIVLGTYIQVLQEGAELLVTTGGNGPCRAGHYAQLHQRILSNMGFHFEMITLELPRSHFRYFLHCLRKLNKAKLSIIALADALRHTWVKLVAIDELERLSHRVRPFETTKFATTVAFRQGLALLDNAETLADMRTRLEEAKELLHNVEQQQRDTLRIGMVGEIFVLLEPYANLELEETLGGLGVEVDRSIFLSGWTQDTTMTDAVGRGNTKTVKQAANPFLSEMIGGHGQDSVGHAVVYAKQGYDGMIHLSPFTCIPEIVAKSILPSISKEFDFPVLSIACDELSGKAGLETRVDAFVDMLRQRRRRKGEDHGHLFGN